MTPAERESLVEAVTSAHRTQDPFTGMPRAASAWHDLDDAGRTDAYEQTLLQRMTESALDPDGLSTTAHAVLRRIRRS